MLAAGSKLGPYEIVAPLGAGGMGEVYRARDARLQREVALKVLPAEFGQDAERVARFDREAKLLASLNHPRIGALYGLEESEGRRVLVLELVAGASLAERLTRGPLPLDEALSVAIQVASALEAAHESGIVHRDLKPGNVMLRPDGTVKVLDFGLAKGGATEGSASDPKLSASPTMTYAATQAGVILGTAAYMSPEQARGRAVDRRSDIWSFGCLLYELLTGQQAFAGETVSDTIASILKSEPDWNALPAGTPRRVSELLRRCLRKDPASRLRDAGDARIELEEVIASPTGGDSPAATAAARPAGPGRGLLIAMAAVTVVALAVTGATLMRGRGVRSDSMQFAIPMPDGVSSNGSMETIAIAPDGRTLAFVALDSTGTGAVWLRPLGSLSTSRVAGTENASGVFWSPDSRSLGFFADAKLKTVAIASGVVRILGDAPDPRGASWSARGTIVLAPASTGPLRAVDAESGAGEDLLFPDSTRGGENSLRFPSFLPDGKHFLFTSLPRSQGLYPIWVGELGSKTRRQVMRAEAMPVWAGEGHVLTVMNDRLVAVRMDPNRVAVSGKPVDLGAAPLALAHDGCWVVSASRDGKLAFTSGSLANTEVVWLDRSGRRVGTVGLPPGRWESFATSPDDTRLAIGRRISPSETKLWIVDLASGQGGPIGSAAAQAGIVWSPDGRWLAYQDEVAGQGRVFVRPMDGGTGRPLVPGARNFQNVWGWSMDSKQVIYSQPNPGTNWDILSAPADGSTPPVSLVATDANENGGVLSPDGRWLAYTSDETGRLDLYARSYPDGAIRKQLGAASLKLLNYAVYWSSSGREILLASGDVIAYPVEPGPTLKVGPGHRLMDLPPGALGVWPSSDHQRFLVSLPIANSAQPQLTLETNWSAALRAR